MEVFLADLKAQAELNPTVRIYPSASLYMGSILFLQLVPLALLAVILVGFTLSSWKFPTHKTSLGPWNTTDHGLKVESLVIYPIKSCRGMELEVAQADKNGFAHDRRFMIVSGKGKFQTQRQLPKMATIVPTLHFKDADAGAIAANVPVSLTLEARGGKSITINVSGNGSAPSGACKLASDIPPTAGVRLSVHIWREDVLNAVDQGPEVAAWLSQVLGEEGLRLVYMDKHCTRSLQHEHGKYGEPAPVTKAEPTTTTSFADMYPFLVTSTASLRDLNALLSEKHAQEHNLKMNRFRGNIIVDGPLQPWEEDTWGAFSIGPMRFHGVKRCVRCTIPTNDQMTGNKAPRRGDQAAEPLATLQEQRTGAKKNEGCFGLNAIHEYEAGDVEGRTLRVGDSVIVHRTTAIGPIVR